MTDASTGAGRKGRFTGAWKGALCVLVLLAAVLSCILALCPGAASTAKNTAYGLYLRTVVGMPGAGDTHRFHQNGGWTSPNAYIAHGGGIGQYALHNSVEAAEDSIRRGFRFIEFDLLVTTDGHLAAAHSWAEMKRMAGAPVSNEPLSLQEVRALSIPGKFTPATGEDICRLLEQHPQLVLVTDRIQDYELLLKEIPHPQRMIVECTRGKASYVNALKAGVLYPSMSVQTASMMKLAYDAGIPIISLKDDNFFSTPQGIGEVRRLHDKGITILLFNYSGSAYWGTPEFIKAHLGKTFSMIYSDSWGPDSIPPSNISQDKS